LAKFLKQNQLPPADYSDIGFFKRMVEKRNELTLEVLGSPPPEVKQSELEYETRDGTKIRAKLYQPNPRPKEGSPLIVMYHGGGFCVGAPEGEEQTCRNLVQAFKVTCISATYRLAPQFPFPTGIDDCWDALKWAAANAKSWGADTSLGFVVGGTSAGGNISAVMALRARDEKLFPPLTGQYLAVPATIPHDAVPEEWKEWYLSHEQNKEVLVLPQAAVDMFMNAYKADPHSPKFNVGAAPTGHENLPPAVIAVDGMDPLRDEGIIYRRILDRAGVKTKLYVYPGLPHAHWGFFPFLQASDKFRKDQIEAMSWLLGRNAEWSNVQTNAEIATG
jgi:acetyl esterase/lipase